MGSCSAGPCVGCWRGGPEEDLNLMSRVGWSGPARMRRPTGSPGEVQGASDPAGGGVGAVQALGGGDLRGGWALRGEGREEVGRVLWAEKAPRAKPRPETS